MGKPQTSYLGFGFAGIGFAVLVALTVREAKPTMAVAGPTASELPQVLMSDDVVCQTIIIQLCT